MENDFSRNALPYATALAGACPRLAPAANVLPAGASPVELARHVHSHCRAGAAGAGRRRAGLRCIRRYSERKYLRKLNAEIAQLEPTAQRSRRLERQIDADAVADADARPVPRADALDLDALNELTRWSSRRRGRTWSTWDAIRRASTGEAPQAAPLLKILDASPFFELRRRTSSAKTGRRTGRVPDPRRAGEAEMMRSAKLDARLLRFWRSRCRCC